MGLLPSSSYTPQATFSSSGKVKQTVYNVRDYGAKGDGTTDDTTSIQSAINALPTSGGVVYFPHGVYIISAKLTIQNHAVSLVGEAWSSIFADQVNNQPGMLGATTIQASLSGFPASTTMIQAGLLGTNKIWTGGGIYNMVISGTKGTTTPGNGIDVFNMQAFRVMNCNINSVAVAYHVKSDQAGGMSNDILEHSILNNLTSYGVWMDSGSDQNYVRFNYIQAYTGYGIRLSGIGNYAVFNHIESGQLAGSGTADGAAIFSEGTYSFIQNNDTSVGTITHGIYVQNSHTQVTDNEMSNVNSTAVANGSGIWVAGAVTDVLIDGNQINDNNAHMVYGIRDTSTTAGGVTIGINGITGYTTAAISTAGNLAPVYLASNLTLGTAGNKLLITTGSNASAGTGTLVGGTATISTTAVTASSLIFLTDTSSSTTNVGSLTVSAKTAGTSFVVTSTIALDTSTFNWMIIN